MPIGKRWSVTHAFAGATKGAAGVFPTGHSRAP